MLNCIKRLVKRILHIQTKEKDNVTIARELGVTFGDDCCILDDPRAVFGSEPYLVCCGHGVEITKGVKFITHNGALFVIRRYDTNLKDVDEFGVIHVGNNVFLGMNTIILPSVTIGSNVIVGAGSLINKDVPDNSVVAGSPARVICSIDEYVEKLKKRNSMVPTKNMSRIEKKEYLQNIHPEWFQ